MRERLFQELRGRGGCSCRSRSRSGALVAERRPPQVDQPDEAAGAAVGQQAAGRRVELGRGDHLWFVAQQSDTQASVPVSALA